MLPMLVLGLILGAVADRIRRTTLLLTIHTLGLLVTSTVSLLFKLDLVSLPVMCVATAIIGMVWAADFSTRRALVSEVNNLELAANAMSMEAMSMQGSKIGATVLSGTLLAVGGASLAYAFLAGIYVLSLASIMRVRRLVAANETKPPVGISVLSLIRSGFSESVKIPRVRAVLLVTVVMNLFVFPYQQLIAVIAGQILHVGPQRMGLLAGIDGIGSIVIGLLLVYRGRSSLGGRYYVSGATLCAVFVVLLALSRLYPLSVGLQLLAGAANAGFASMQPVLILNAVEPQMRARAMGVLAMAIGCMPIGLLLSGTLSSVFGPSRSLAATALLALVLLALILYRNRTLIRA
jgi:MFS family permease